MFLSLLLVAFSLGCKKSTPIAGDTMLLCPPESTNLSEETTADPYGTDDTALMVKCTGGGEEKSKLLFTWQTNNNALHRIIEYMPGTNEIVSTRSFPLPSAYQNQVDLKVLTSGKFCGLIDIMYFDDSGALRTTKIEKPCFNHGDVTGGDTPPTPESLTPPDNRAQKRCIISLEEMWYCPASDDCGEVLGMCL